MAAVTPADVATTLGRPTPSNTSETYKQWDLWISDAYAIIGSRLGDTSLLDEPTLNRVVREAVATKVRNTSADGTTSKTVTVDDGTVTTRRERELPTDLEDILDGMLDQLRPGSSPDAFSTRPGFERDCPSRDARLYGGRIWQ